jgi:PKD repeat protein
MKKAGSSMCDFRKIFSLLLLIILFSFQVNSTNPLKSNFLTNLSAQVNQAALNDLNPEMIISGNTIHVLWRETNYQTDKLYYCRSTDLGKTWELPKLIANSKGWSQSWSTQTRQLAVDGDNVNIAFYDSNDSNNWARMLYYIHSTDGGSSFGSVQELVKVDGGYASFTSSQIKAANGKVAIVYHGTGWKNGVFVLFSSDNGGTFTEKPVTDVLNNAPSGGNNSSNLSDFWYDGSQMVVVFEYTNGNYDSSFGLVVGKVWVSVSNDDAASFVTNKVSISATDVGEKCRSNHDSHYSPKIAKSGNNIHVVFAGANENNQWTTLYARSTDNGKTFEKAKDINNGILSGASIQLAEETVVAKNGHVYLAYLSKAAKVFFVQSDDNGDTFSTSKSILPDGSVWWISLVADPSDASGSTVYLTSNAMVSIKSIDGGNNFSQFIVCSPFLESNISDIISDMVIDLKGNKHWITEAKWRTGSDRDIFYKFIGHEPEPGTINKAYSLDIVLNSKQELLVVPSSPSLDFDSAMTAEAWVKFNDPASIIYYGAVNILGKPNGADGADFQPSGYNMGFRTSKGEMVLNSGLKTDKGEFVNWGSRTIGDTLWHHIAFTYDINGGLNNFKTYVDGLLSVEQTVYGKIVQGNGMLMIGSRANYNQSAQYHIDNMRLWNKALSQEELVKNQLKTFTGKEAGLKLFFNFDDTFKDISGNGNDGIPLYWGELKNSDFNPPVPEFDLYQTLNQVSLTNKSQNGTTYSWNFGDGTVSGKGNPVYTYPKPGEYNISLEAQNANSKTAIVKKATVAGLDRIEPSVAGNTGFASISVFGGGINKKSTFKIVKDGAEIAADTSSVLNEGELNATFDLSGQSVGKWDVVVQAGTDKYVLSEALTIEGGKAVDPYVYVSGRSAVLKNRWQVQTIEIGNKGNVDLFNVPLFVAVSNVPGIEIDFINIDFVLDDFSNELGHDFIKDSIPLSFIQEGFFNGETNILKSADVQAGFRSSNFTNGGQDAIIFPLMLKTLPQNSSLTILVRVKSTENYEFVSWVYSFSGGNALKSAEAKRPDPFGDCLKDAIISNLYTAGAQSVKILLSTLPIGCVKSSVTAISNSYGTIQGGKPQVKNTLWDLASIAVSCASDVYPPAKAYKFALTVTGGIMTLYSGFSKYYSCFDKFFVSKNSIFAFSSFDPNEMIGPSGFGEEHWIQKNNTIPYTILFENKSTATAPAHIVTVTDTLDLTKFDIEEFGFGSFGFGDTICSPNGNKLKEFSMDIDLRPEMNLITRVSGILDTISGVIKWEFISLNPSTLEYEEDPFIGFLPPNNTESAGEGFVSFSVGLKKELGTNSVLKNIASIVFDANKPILTNEYVNKLDLDKPQSQVYPLNETIDSHFPLAWTGSDNGSGIASYTIYVMENDTALRPWKLNTPLNTAEFIGNVGSKYKFYSVATDNVSLFEDSPAQYDASTHITVNVEEFEMKKDEFQVFPNPVKDKLTISLANAPCGMYVVELVGVNGQVYYSEIHDDFSISKGIQIDVNGLQSGNYLVRMVYGNKSVTRKVMIR